MLAAICHESFYTSGAWIDEALGVYVGWAAHARSFADGMPLEDADSGRVLVFAGEEYPEPGIRQRLRGDGHHVPPEGPSYLVHLTADDRRFPGCLNGIFHGLLVDRPTGAAFLFNDRYGMGRVYYHEAKEAFYFGCEAKAILAARPDLRLIDAQGMGEFISCGCVMENRTLFRGIRTLPSASKWLLRNGGVERKDEYFQPREWESQEALEPEPYYQAIRSAFSERLPRYFTGTRPIAVALTGGLDTRAVMAWRPVPGSLPCYTFGSMFRDSEDVMIARRVAQACGQTHAVIEVGEEFLSRFSHYAERSVYLTDGTVDVYRAPDLYVSEQARQMAPVKVVGTYGSEILRHTPMFTPRSVCEGLFISELQSYIQKARQTFARVSSEHAVTFATFRQSPWYHYGILSLEQTQLTVRSPYLDSEVVRTVFRGPKLPKDVRIRLIADGNPALIRIRTDRGVAGDGGLFRSALKRSLLEFSFKAEYAYDSGMPQWLARINRILAPLQFEYLFLGRHKLSHFRVWYRDKLSNYVQQILLDPRTLGRPYLDGKGVEAVVRGHVTGRRNFTREIHKLLTLELVHRQFFDPR
jgi:asparagine synthase (glutamine-hydrolysing)